jgi:predicted ABC-type sugar transport system permease subunit
MVAAAVVAAITVVAGHALPLKLSIPLAALAGIGAGLAFERSWR